MFRQKGTDRADRLTTGAVVDLQLLSCMMRATRFLQRRSTGEGILLAEEVPRLVKRQHAVVAQGLRHCVSYHHRTAGKLSAVHALVGGHMITALAGLTQRIFFFSWFLPLLQYFHEIKISGEGLKSNVQDF
jgi:hypothetical protein